MHRALVTSTKYKVAENGNTQSTGPSNTYLLHSIREYMRAACHCSWDGNMMSCQNTGMAPQICGDTHPGNLSILFLLFAAGSLQNRDEWVINAGSLRCFVASDLVENTVWLSGIGLFMMGNLWSSLNNTNILFFPYIFKTLEVCQTAATWYLQRQIDARKVDGPSNRKKKGPIHHEAYLLGDEIKFL